MNSNGKLFSYSVSREVIYLYIFLILVYFVGFKILTASEIKISSVLEDGNIEGRVTDEYGQSINDLIVTACLYDSTSFCGGTRFEVKTNADGIYQFKIPEGKYVVYINCHGHPGHFVSEIYPGINSISYNERIKAIPLDVVGNQTISGINFSLPVGFTISGRLIDNEGQPVLGAGGNISSIFQNIEFGEYLGFGTSGIDGSFKINVPAGSYQLEFGKGNDGYTVRKNLVIKDNVDLGDVLFADVLESPSLTFDPQVQKEGYTVENVVPGALNSPFDVTVAANNIYTSGFGIYIVEEDGNEKFISDTNVHAIDAGPDGNLYGCSGDEHIFRIIPGGNTEIVGELLPITPHSSDLTVAPNGTIWIGRNHWDGINPGITDTRLYKLSKTGVLDTIGTGYSTEVLALDFSIGGQLYMTTTTGLFMIDTTNGSKSLLVSLPSLPAEKGLVISPDGNFYISSQGSENDIIYRVTPTGEISTFTTLPPGGIEGLAYLSNDYIVATMRKTGSVYRVQTSGQWETLSPGNGMSTPMSIAFDLNEDLFVLSDEAYGIFKIIDGYADFFVEVVSFVSPEGYMAFEPSGNFFFTEAAPGFPSRLVVVSSNGSINEVTTDLDYPSGLAFSPQGTLFVAENVSGEISIIEQNGIVRTYLDGLTRPRCIAFDNYGNLYVAEFSGVIDNPDDVSDNPGSNSIWKIDSNNERILFAELAMSSFTISPSNEIYATGRIGSQSGIFLIKSNGQVETFAVGFIDALGLAFDIQGNLYVSDKKHNSVTKISGFPDGLIRGFVKDVINNRPVKNARISIKSNYPIVLGTEVKTDSTGFYSIHAAPRTYSLMASFGANNSSTQQATISIDDTLNINFDINIPTNIDLISHDIPKYYELSQNYPNPFNSETKIKFQIPKTSNITLKIYNVNGQEIKTLLDKPKQAGYYSSIWEGLDNSGKIVSSGIYFYVMKSKYFTRIKKMTLIQ
jgi:sugar lactone lactonase YvrE